DGGQAFRVSSCEPKEVPVAVLRPDTPRQLRTVDVPSKDIVSNGVALEGARRDRDREGTHPERHGLRQRVNPGASRELPAHGELIVDRNDGHIRGEGGRVRTSGYHRCDYDQGQALPHQEPPYPEKTAHELKIWKPSRRLCMR